MKYIYCTKSVKSFDNEFKVYFLIMQFSILGFFSQYS